MFNTRGARYAEQAGSVYRYVAARPSWISRTAAFAFLIVVVLPVLVLVLLALLLAVSVFAVLALANAISLTLRQGLQRLFSRGRGRPDAFDGTVRRRNLQQQQQPGGGAHGSGTAWRPTSDPRGQAVPEGHWPPQADTGPTGGQQQGPSPRASASDSPDTPDGEGRRNVRVVRR